MAMYCTNIITDPLHVEVATIPSTETEPAEAASSEFEAAHDTCQPTMG